MRAVTRRHYSRSSLDARFSVIVRVSAAHSGREPAGTTARYRSIHLDGQRRETGEESGANPRSILASEHRQISAIVRIDEA